MKTDRAMWPQDKEHQESPGAGTTRKQPPRASGGMRARCGLRGSDSLCFCSFKPLSLWLFFILTAKGQACSLVRERKKHSAGVWSCSSLSSSPSC